MHRYRLVEATHCDVPLEVLLGAGRFDPARLEPSAEDPEDGGGHGTRDTAHIGHSHGHTASLHDLVLRERAAAVARGAAEGSLPLAR